MEKIPQENPRPNWEEYFIAIVDAVALRASCDRGKSGCIIVKDNRILSTGYVGAPTGFKNCYEAGHLIREVIYENGEVKQHCVRTIHAEQNAIISAAKFGIAIQGATLYCTLEPCTTCAMLITSAGIKKVVAKYKYHASKATIEILKEAGVELIVVNSKYSY
ncbi:Deoxycytidylate deaminase [Candidatus Hepatincolaceae symbiont of Richtersius coronifer]